ADRPTLARELADTLRDDTVCVVGYSGWGDAFTSALYRVTTRRDIDVLWAVPGSGYPQVPPPVDPAQTVPVYLDVDSNRLFPELERTLRVPVHESDAERSPTARRVATPPAGTSSHRFRQEELEQLLGARTSADELLRQLDHEFGWRLEGGAG